MGAEGKKAAASNMTVDSTSVGALMVFHTLAVHVRRSVVSASMPES